MRKTAGHHKLCTRRREAEPCWPVAQRSFKFGYGTAVGDFFEMDHRRSHFHRHQFSTGGKSNPAWVTRYLTMQRSVQRARLQIPEAKPILPANNELPIISREEYKSLFLGDAPFAYGFSG